MNANKHEGKDTSSLDDLITIKINNALKSHAGDIQDGDLQPRFYNLGDTKDNTCSLWTLGLTIVAIITISFVLAIAFAVDDINSYEEDFYIINFLMSVHFVALIAGFAFSIIGIMKSKNFTKHKGRIISILALCLTSGGIIAWLIIFLAVGTV